MKYCILLVFFVISLTEWGQENPTLELEYALQIQDTAEQLKFLDSLTTIYREEWIPGAKPLIDRRIELLAAAGRSNEISEIIIPMVRYFMNTQQRKEALALIDQYLATYGEIRDDGLRAELLYHRSYAHEILRNTDEAFADINAAIIFYEKENVDRSVVQYRDAYRGQARLLHVLGDFGGSLTAFTKSRDLNETYLDSVGMAYTLWDMGMLFGQAGLFDQADSLYRERYRYIEETAKEKGRYQMTMGRNFLMQGDPVSALPFYERAIKVMPKEQDAAYARLLLRNGLIESYFFAGQEDRIPSAFNAFEKDYQDVNPEATFDFLLDQSRFLNLLVQGNYAAAEPIGLELYQNSLPTKDANANILHLSFLSELYQRKGDFEKAFVYNNTLADLRDSTKSVVKSQAFSLFQTQFETREKQSQIDQLSLDQELAKSRIRLWTSIALGLIFLLLVGSYLYRQLALARKTVVQKNAQLNNLNKTKDKFFSIIAHDIRSPIAALQTVDKQIQYYAAKEDTAKVQKVAGLVGNTARNLNTLLDNLLNWSLSQTGGVPHHPENISVQIIAKEVIEIHRASAEAKGIVLTSSIPEDISVHADPAALATILRNLVSNAIKYSSSGDRVEITSSSKNGSIEITVHDEGQGMPPEKLERLFDLAKKSQTGTDGEKGTGLGLILCKELVELNGGKLLVRSEAGKGTDVLVILPGEDRLRV